MVRRSIPKGVHRVRRWTAGGRVHDKPGYRFHFFAWRPRGPKFWIDEEREPTDPAFYLAYAEAVKRKPTGAYMVPQLCDDFLDGLQAAGKAPRTLKDYRPWLSRIAEEFKDDPAAIFEEPESRAEVSGWRKRWRHSPRQYDYAATVLTHMLNWSVDEGKLRLHHCHRLPKLYSVDRSEIVWTPDHCERLLACAPTWVARIAIAAWETGLRPGDLVRLSWTHIEATPHGRRIRIRTNKRKRTAAIPVTPAMAEVLDATPADRMLILVSAQGKPLTEHRASEALRQWRDKAGLGPDNLGFDLRLQDARGTAATRLLDAGLSLSQIASHMGWSLRHAAAVIEHYARVSPDETDRILVQLARAKGSKA